MENEDSFKGVKIGHGACFIKLEPSGEAAEYGFPTQIHVVAGPFSGSFRDAFVGSFEQFYRELEDLQKSLKGRASLGSLEGHLNLVLSGNGKGIIHIEAEVIAQQVPRITLIFENEIDQSFLPKILLDTRRFFLVPARDA